VPIPDITHAKPRVPYRPLLAAATAGVLSILLWVAPASAATQGELQSQLDSAKQRAQSLAGSLEARQSELVAMQARAQAAAAREAQLSTLLSQGQQRAAELAAQVDRARTALAVTKRHLARAQHVLAKRLVAIYKSGQPDATSVILDARGFDDLVTRADYLRAIEDSDTALATRVRELRNQVAHQLAAVETAKAAADAYDRRVAAARDQVSAARAQAESQASALAAARAQEAAALGGLRSQMSGWADQISKLQQVSQQQAQQQVGTWLHGFSIPQAIVMCESGGNYGAVNPSSGAGGAYQILPSTWSLYGGKGAPQSGSKPRQDQIASQIWADSGPSAWVCAG
jgi:peptidoglycan hydrolase CwlO-like protein